MQASRQSCSKLAAEFPNYESLSLADLMKDGQSAGPGRALNVGV